MLEISNLTFYRNTKAIIKNFSSRINKAKLVCLKGQNGVGKTTLLRLISGLLYSDSGNIKYKGEDISKVQHSYQSKICYIGHKSGLSPYLSILENYALGIDHKLSSGLKLDNVMHNMCSELSSGQLKKAALLELFQQERQVWLLDEPFTSLDATSTTFIASCIEKFVATGGMCILSSHLNLNLRQQRDIYLS